VPVVSPSGNVNRSPLLARHYGHSERSARNLIRLIRPFALLRMTHATGSLGEPGLCKQHTSNMRESVVLLRNRFGRFNINLERRALLSHRESSVRKRDFNSFRVEGFF